MKKQIRRGVFETNSSSMHSLVVTKNSEYYTAEEVKESLYVNKEGFIQLDQREMYFGRTPFDVLTSFEEKLRYTLASLCHRKGDAAYEEIKQVVKSFVPDFVDFKTDLKALTHDMKYCSEEQIKDFYGEGNYIKKDGYIVTWGLWLRWSRRGHT